MSRTTVDLDPGVIVKLKHIGANTGESMSRVINRLLRHAVQDRPARPRAGVCFAWRTVKQGRPAEDFNPASREYLDLIENGR